MDEFDLFDLVYMQENQSFLKSSIIHETTMYTLYGTPINNGILQKNTNDSNKKRTVQLINYSAKKYTDIKHGLIKLTSTSTNPKKINYVQKFLTNSF